MRSVHWISLATGPVWLSGVLLALLGSGISAAAGTLPSSWGGAAMVGSFAYAGVISMGVVLLPETWPRLVRQLLLIVVLSTSLWSVGTLIRVLYALTG